MNSNTNSNGSATSETKDSVTISAEERDAINILFPDFIRVSKHNDYYIAEDSLLHLAEQGSSEEEAVDNLMNEIEEHLIAIKKIKAQKEEFDNAIKEAISS